MPEGRDFLKCKNCNAPMAPDEARCAYCGVYLAVPPGRPWERLTKSRSARVRLVYPSLICLGLGIMIYLYGVAFDRMSETFLVQITPLWFFSLTFGVYGYVAEKMLDRVAAGQAPDIAAAFVAWRKESLGVRPISTMVLGLLLFTFTYVKTTSSLLTAFLGSAAWGVLLWIFFNGIFPSL